MVLSTRRYSVTIIKKISKIIAKKEIIVDSNSINYSIYFLEYRTISSKNTLSELSTRYPPRVAKSTIYSTLSDLVDNSPYDR